MHIKIRVGYRAKICFSVDQTALQIPQSLSLLAVAQKHGVHVLSKTTGNMES
jgi:pyruvate-formate lyase-activating enzyme